MLHEALFMADAASPDCSAGHRLFEHSNLQTLCPSIVCIMRTVRKDYWGEALSSLEKHKQGRIKQELLNKEDLTSLTSWPDIIAGMCRREQVGLQTKERKLRFAGREIDLRKMMDSWTEFLDKIKQIGDVAVDADPSHAGLPWAAVRFILTVRLIAIPCV
jgi:hypothetical protein